MSCTSIAVIDYALKIMTMKFDPFSSFSILTGPFSTIIFSYDSQWNLFDFAVGFSNLWWKNNNIFESHIPWFPHWMMFILVTCWIGIQITIWVSFAFYPQFKCILGQWLFLYAGLEVKSPFEFPLHFIHNSNAFLANGCSYLSQLNDTD